MANDKELISKETPPSIKLTNMLAEAMDSDEIIVTKSHHGKQTDWKFASSEKQEEADALLEQMGVKFDDPDSERSKWFKHNMWEIGRSLKDNPDFDIMPLDFNNDVSWEEWLARYTDMLNDYPISGNAHENQLVKSFFTGFGNVDDGEGKIRDRFIDLALKEDTHVPKEAIVRVFGADGLNWLNLNEVDRLQKE